MKRIIAAAFAILCLVDPQLAEGGSSGATLLTTGARIAHDRASVRTGRIVPDRSKRVVVHVVMATTDGSPAPTPSLRGGRARWRRLATIEKSAGAPRNLTAFTATGVRRGRLKIGFPFSSRMHVAWTVSQASGSLGSREKRILSGRDTSLSITFDRRPEGVVIAGFAIGYPGDVDVASPYRELGQSNTTILTVLAARGSARTVTVSWPQPGHALGYAVEIE